MKTLMMLLLTVAIPFAASCKPASPPVIKWTTKQVHPHGVGMKCQYCSQTWDAIPKNISAKEQQMLKSLRKKFYALHLKVCHGIVVADKR